MENYPPAWTVSEIIASGTPIAPVTSFEYLGRFLMVPENDCPTVVSNLWQERQNWAHLSWVMIRVGVYNQTSGIIHVAVVQAVLLYGLEAEVTTPRIGEIMG